jgi:DNA-binding NtrC family response regulator
VANRSRQYPHMLDATMSTLSHSDASRASDATVADELILLAECNRPLAGSARHRLVDTEEVLIGRGNDRRVERTPGGLTLRVADGRISTVHATLRRQGLAYIINDEQSKNGVIVNGRRIQRELLHDGDVIECGRTFFLFKMAQSRPADEPLDLDFADVAATTGGLLTFHEPLAAQLRALVEVARTSIPVLILGATGSGKELVARAVHTLSERSGGFVGVNCGALPETLVEAELFGARRGAFTGAVEDKPGLVRASDRGTLFLDEIGDLPSRAQPTLLRVLQEREVMSVGAIKAVPVDLRVVAATHRDLEGSSEPAHFRADLLARLSGFVVRLPPLRERIADLGLLIAALLRRHAGAHATTTISAEAMRLMLRHDWPLNVRQLEHCLRAALALSPTRIDAVHLPRTIREPSAGAAADRAAQQRPNAWTPEQLARREELCQLLTQYRGNISAVARHLGKDRVQIRRWIKQLDIRIDEEVVS